MSIISPIFALELQLFNKKDVRLNFQKSITDSQMTLPVVYGVVILLWFLTPPILPSDSYSTTEYGLWHHLPLALQQGYWSLGIGAFCASLAIYAMAELNNANVLLRVGSRMLSTTLAFLLGLVVICHLFQPGMLLMLFVLLSFFPLFASYQTTNPFLSFLTFLMVSVASLVFPKWLWIVPVYWIIQGYLRSFTLRCFLASLLAVMLPYWFYGAIALMTESTGDFLSHLQEMVSFQGFDYTQLDRRELVVFLFVILLFLTGVIDFYLHRYQDKTRTRILYNVLVLYGIVITLWIGIQPQYFTTLLPVLILPTAILFGHFFTFTHTRFSHILCIILLVLSLVVVTLQYLPPPILRNILIFSY